MKKIAVLLYFLGITIQSEVIAQDCHCTKDEIGFIFKHRVSICGSENIKKWPNGFLLSELVVKDCVAKKIIIDSRSDATEIFAIRRFTDSVIITDLQLIPDSTMQQLMYVPLAYRVLKAMSNGLPTISKSKFIFRTPKITAHQKQYLDSLCLNLKSKIMKPITYYPFDKISLYGLFLGAIVNYGDCYNLFVNLDKYFILDGAIAETRAEIPFEYIRKNK